MNFRPVTPSDYPELTRFFEHQTHRICVYSLPSLLVWYNDLYQPFAAADGDSLYIGAEYTVKKQDRHLILPVSPDRDFSPEELSRLARSLGFCSYWFVPEHYIDSRGRSDVEAYFTIKAQPQFDDYIYLTEDLALLKGNRYAKKRNLIRQFHRHYLSKGRVQTETITPDNAAECLVFLEQWCESRDCDIKQDEDLTCEKQAVTHMMEHIDRFPVHSRLVRIDGQVSAFAVTARLTDDMAVMHFEKAYTHIRGLYQFLDNQCAKDLVGRYRYLNKESDMNLPGLAKSKQSYHPVEKVKSFELIVRQD